MKTIYKVRWRYCDVLLETRCQQVKERPTEFVTKDKPEYEIRVYKREAKK